jgi:C-terminal processing protease CtpA/Prc
MWPAGTAYGSDRRQATRVSRLGRAVCVAYNTTTVDTTGLARHIAWLAAKPGVRRIVVDLRNNRGGDNNTYPPLIEELQRLARHHKRTVVLAGRATFSAAANFMGDLETATRYLLVGEDSGGAPNLYGDVEPLDLPATGLRVEVATTWWVKSRLGAKDPRLTFHPDVVVSPTAKSWFAGRDPALAVALYASFARAHRVH